MKNITYKIRDPLFRNTPRGGWTIKIPVSWQIWDQIYMQVGYPVWGPVWDQACNKVRKILK